MPKLSSINPATNALVGEVSISTLQEIQEKVAKAHAAKKSWKMLGVKRRIEMLRPFLDIYKSRLKEIATLATQEMGKPITQSLADFSFDSTYFEDFITNAPHYLENEIMVQEPSASHQIVYEPLGVAAVIAPWNYPFSNFVISVMPALIAGNTVVFKHSEECPLIGKLAEEMMAELHLPEGVFSEVYGGGEVGRLLAEQDVDLIVFTGSSKTGKQLFEIAGKKQIKAVLEMGGSDPAIVFPDANLDQIIPTLYERRFTNAGQICCAIKRVIVHKSIYDELVEKLVNHLQNIKIGDPLDPNTEMGPLAAERQVELLESQVNEAIGAGAKVAIGGQRPEGLKGAYYLPTVLTNINRDMRIWKEEVFGPVLPVISFNDEQEAIDLANDTMYGLGSAVYSADIERARRVAAQLEAGSVDINQGSHWRPCNPFLGHKASGMGCIHGKYGFRDLCKIKVIAE